MERTSTRIVSPHGSQQNNEDGRQTPNNCVPAAANLSSYLLPIHHPPIRDSFLQKFLVRGLSTPKSSLLFTSMVVRRYGRTQSDVSVTTMTRLSFISFEG